MECHWLSRNNALFKRIQTNSTYLIGLLAFVGCLIPLFIAIWGIGRVDHYYVLAKEIVRVEKVFHARKQEAKKQRALCQLNTDADTQFLDHIVTSCKFLQPQEAKLQEVKDVLDDKSKLFVCDNLHVLSENKLVFQACPDNSEKMQLKHPVYMNLSDLEQLMALIEGVKVGSHAPHPLRGDLSFDRITMKRVYNSPGIISVNFTVRKG